MQTMIGLLELISGVLLLVVIPATLADIARINFSDALGLLFIFVMMVAGGFLIWHALPILLGASR